MNIIEKMEEAALIFMIKRKKIEEKTRIEILKKIDNLKSDTLKAFKSSGNINISYLPIFINNEIQPIVDKYKNEQHNIIDAAIRNDYEVGIENGQKLLSLSNEIITPVNKELKDSDYEEILVALLLYGERLIDNLHEDLLNNLNKDITSIYITSKNIRNYNSEKEINTKKDSTLNTTLNGSIISRYINPTFKNITNRADLIARNETNRALNHGHLMRYIKASEEDFKGLKIKWVEVRDDRLCQHCRDAANGGEHGNGVYDIDSISPPPLHSRCRCIIIPFLAKWYNTEY